MQSENDGTKSMTDLAYHKVHSEAVAVPDGCPVDSAFSPYAEKYVAYPLHLREIMQYDASERVKKRRYL